jgi:hypothetical protein
MKHAIITKLHQKPPSCNSKDEESKANSEHMMDTGEEEEKPLSYQEYENEYEKCLSAEAILFKSAVSSLA